jgi:hypothetical protein
MINGEQAVLRMEEIYQCSFNENLDRSHRIATLKRRKDFQSLNEENVYTVVSNGSDENEIKGGILNKKFHPL